jgi:hypothetical protein
MISNPGPRSSDAPACAWNSGSPGKIDQGGKEDRIPSQCRLVRRLGPGDVATGGEQFGEADIRFRPFRGDELAFDQLLPGTGEGGTLRLRYSDRRNGD